MRAILVKLFFDKTDVAAAFHAGEPNFGQVVDVRIKTQVFFQVVRGDVVTPHHAKITLSVADDNVRFALNQNTKRVRIVCQMREEHGAALLKPRSRRLWQGTPPSH